MNKTIRLGSRLRYPITIVKLLKKPGDVIKRQEPILQYSFKWEREVGDSVRADVWKEEQTTIVEWDSPSEGDLKQWMIKEGEVIGADAPCMVVKEACSHEIQFQGLCAICGKDMTEVNWAAETKDTDRAPISMVHDQTNLTVSQVQAQRTENDLQRRLLQSRKLSLVVDLDQTIIHACIDPTVGEWQKDPTNPNYNSVKDVKSFQLDDGPRGLAKGCWYYIKMRPGLQRFLRRISEMYELHVYTMGTRAYAQSVARIVDPEQKLFGNRVISRDENGNMFAKSLQRLFPVSTNMVVIIDDRADVWPRNRHNLIKVSPYDFFKGIGDINSSFLPRRQDLLAPTGATDETLVNGNGAPKAAEKKESTAEAPAADVSALDELVNMTGGDDSVITKRQVEEQERTLEKQIKDRPLQLLQDKQDKEDEEAEKASTHSEDGDETPPSSPPHHRHQVLRDDDTELDYLEKHLTHLHSTYYEEYDRKRASQKHLSSVPDVGETLDELKSNVLRGLRIALTGIIPNDISTENSEIGQQLISFGATIMPKINRKVTHLVVSTLRPGTSKMMQAFRYPSIKIVNQDWLATCFSKWEVVDETPYLFKQDPKKQIQGVASDAEDTNDERPAVKKLRLKAPKLKLASASGDTEDLDEDSDDEDDGDDDDELDDDADGPDSPIDKLKTFNWGSADAELDEFLASGSEDDEEEEDGEARGTEGVTDDEPMPSRKRKFDGEESEVGEEGATDSEQASTQDENAAPRSGRGSQSKKLRRTKSVRGTSSLRNQYVSDVDGDGDGNSSLPTPQVTGDEDEILLMKKMAPVAGQNQAQAQEDVDFDDMDDAQLEAELEAEFMAEFEAETLAADAGGDRDQEKG